MLPALLAVAVLTLLAVAMLLLRKPPATAPAAPDERLTLLLSANLPGQMADLNARSAALDAHLRAEFAGLRGEAATEATRSREAAEKAAAALRDEVLRNIQALGQTLRESLDGFRTDNNGQSKQLKEDVARQLEALTQRFTAFSAQATEAQTLTRDALQTQLAAVRRDQAEQGDKLRETVQVRLDKLNTDNSAKLEQMRETVDEKLQKTLNERLTASFGQVTTHLGEVQKGLGEMKELATGVGDLKKVLTNVKARGIVGEFQLGQQLEQMFSPEQYVKNARIKPDSAESVEYALKFPNGPGSTVLLPIDAKFPREDWERLESAYETGTAEEIAVAGKAFERAIRAEGKRICEKYIDPPTTLPHGVMFLPTEGLYAEVVRRPGLQSELQQQCRVTIAGPSTFMAILTSFQMGFHTMAIEKKGNEVWNVLGRVRSEFENFGGLMEKVEKNVGTVQNTLKEIRGKTTTINRSLKNVASLDTGAPTARLLTMDGVAPLLAAVGDDDAEA